MQMTAKQVLIDQMKMKFEEIDKSLQTLNDNFATQTQSKNAAMLAVYDQMQTLVRMLKVDMTSAMSITITYTDNDGD